MIIGMRGLHMLSSGDGSFVRGGLEIMSWNCCKFFTYPCLDEEVLNSLNFFRDQTMLDEFLHHVRRKKMGVTVAFTAWLNLISRILPSFPSTWASLSHNLLLVQSQDFSARISWCGRNPVGDQGAPSGVSIPRPRLSNQENAAKHSLLPAIRKYILYRAPFYTSFGRVACRLLDSASWVWKCEARQSRGFEWTTGWVVQWTAFSNCIIGRGRRQDFGSLRWTCLDNRGWCGGGVESVMRGLLWLIVVED